MTEADEVSAVVEGGALYTSKVPQCYVDHQTFYVNTGVTLLDQESLMQWSPYVWQPSSPNLDRSAIETLNGLSQKGFFTASGAGAGIRPGFLYSNDATTE